MKTRDDLLQVLGGLGETDRRWIVARLSPTVRASLIGDEQASASANGKSLARSTVGTSADATIETSGHARLARASARSVVAMLVDEPAWVLHALLQAEQWSWRDEVLQLSSAVLRNDIARLNTAGIRYAQKVVDALVVEAAQLVADAGNVAPPSSFEAMVDKLGAKFSRRRQGLRA